MPHSNQKQQIALTLPAGLQREVSMYCAANDISPSDYVAALVEQFMGGARTSACSFGDAGESMARLNITISRDLIDACNGMADLLAGFNRRYRAGGFLVDLITSAHAKTVEDIQAGRGLIPADFHPSTSNLTALEWPEGLSRVVVPAQERDVAEILCKPRRGRPRKSGTDFTFDPFPIESWQLGIKPSEAAEIIQAHIKEHPRLEYLKTPAMWMRAATHHLGPVVVNIKDTTEKRRLYRLRQECKGKGESWTMAHILNTAMTEARVNRLSPNDANN